MENLFFSVLFKMARGFEDVCETISVNESLEKRLAGAIYKNEK